MPNELIEENGERELSEWEDEQLRRLSESLDDVERDLAEREQEDINELKTLEEETERELSKREEEDLKQLKEEYEADLRELAPTEVEDLKKLEAEYNRNKQTVTKRYEDERRYSDQYTRQQSLRIKNQYSRQSLVLKGNNQLEQTRIRIQRQKESEKRAREKEVEITPAPPQKKPEVKPSLIIARTPYPKWWKDLQTIEITIDEAKTETIITANSNFFLYIATIVLTVDGETDITFYFGNFGPSGSMDLGGDGEPRGMVIAMGNSPVSCGTGAFLIKSSESGVHVGGFVSFYREGIKEVLYI